MNNEKIGRNELCPCESGKKYKKCCLIEALQHSDSIDPAWRTLRRTEGELISDHLLLFALKAFSKEIMEIAWEEFTLGEEWSDEIYDNLDESLFFPWFLFDWVPEKNEKCNIELPQQTIALEYLQRYRLRLTASQIDFIETISKTYYSFYTVMNVIPRQSIRYKDILLQTEHLVKEFQGTDALRRGDIVFARILTMGDTSICVGTAPRIVPLNCHLELLDYRKDLMEKNDGLLNNNLLRENAQDLRWIYFNGLEEEFNKPAPILHNTDGDLFEFCTVQFKLEIGPHEAYEKLFSLTLSGDKNEFLEDAKKDKNGLITRIEFPWLKLGNKQNKSWENTLMGRFKINGTKMTIEVNSQARAEKAKKLVKKYLGDGAIYLKVKVKSVESAMKTVKKPSQELLNEDINQHPEVQAYLRNFSEKHWEDWLNKSIPALDGLTPREAAKNKDSCERLEALLLDFESTCSRDPDNPSNPDILSLRKELGLKPVC